jgi:hypothetical protein
MMGWIKVLEVTRHTSQGMCGSIYLKHIGFGRLEGLNAHMHNQGRSAQQQCGGDGKGTFVRPEATDGAQQ